jgi:hypothetical protein
MVKKMEDKMIKKISDKETREIKNKAYELYAKHGFKNGNAFVDWLEAEKEEGREIVLKQRKKMHTVLHRKQMENILQSFSAAGAASFITSVRSADYQSEDGTSGATVNVPVAKMGGGKRTLLFKNGLYTGYMDS